ncbi:MAG: hypothetical protein KTR24_10815 [Saprospiraceae bacterium]|nr:hypothetical protein [Saprospiraceae bacterium]
MAKTLVQFFFFLTGLGMANPAVCQRIKASTQSEAADYGQFVVPLTFSHAQHLSKEKLTPETYGSLFYVRVHPKINVLGRHFLTDSSLVFQPKYLPDPSLVHHAYLDLALLAHYIPDLDHPLGIVHQEISFAGQQQSPATEILRLSPNFDTVPENILRTYLHFTAPMGFENPFAFISLLNEAGDTLKDAFVELPEGLWNRDRTRLTLLFHPGRIKRGVGLRQAMGPQLMVNQVYRLVVSSHWKDAHGNRLKAPLSKKWIIGEAFRDRLRLCEWQLGLPRSSSRAPLLVRPKTPLDPVLAQKMLTISQNDQVMVGIWMQTGKREWRFTPKEEWSSGTYTLSADAHLEDIAGNTMHAAFDVESGAQSNMSSNCQSIDIVIK